MNLRSYNEYMNEKYIIEKTAFYKLWLTFLVTIDASITAWYFNNVYKIGSIKIITITLTIFIITISILILTQKTRKMIKRLEE